MARISIQGCQNNALNNHGDSRSARLFQCGRCCVQLKICSCCDRGNIYCVGCAVPARQQARQARQARQVAAKRYQLSPKGRLSHVARQSRYRQRQRLRNKKVTHQGSHDSISMLTAQSDSSSENKQPELTVSIKKTAINCNYCAQECSPFLRRDFMLQSHRLLRKNGSSQDHQSVPETG